MDIYSIINTIVTIFLGGGWFIYYKANKKKANGEATTAEERQLTFNEMITLALECAITL